MIVITGTSRGIGNYLFKKYQESEGNAVFGTYFTTKPNQDKSTRNIFRVDIADQKSVQNFFASIEKRLSSIVLINCAAISYNSFAHKSDPELWRKVIETNLIGTYHMIRCFLPRMREQNFGRIINFSSVVAQKGTPGVSAYAASKAALWGMAKSIAQENGSKGITINNINLGYADIGMGREQVPKEFLYKVKNQIPSKELCRPGQIFKTVEFIRDNGYLNGISIDLSGGFV